MRLVSSQAVMDLICEITNAAMDKRGFTKSDIQHRLVYEVGIMPSVAATEEQFIEIKGDEDLKMEGE